MITLFIYIISNVELNSGCNGSIFTVQKYSILHFAIL